MSIGEPQAMTPQPLSSLAALPPDLWPNIEHLVTEDETPVDGMYLEKQMRLLTEPLYSSWAALGQTRLFLASANVGLFYGIHEPPVVPDVLLSMDVKAADNLLPRRNRSYFVWEFGKLPDAAIEVVSNLEGMEDAQKLALYARIGVPYYIIWDPENLLKKGRLSVFTLLGKAYQPMTRHFFPPIGLGVTVWHGVFERSENDWLRWCDAGGQLIPTGAERAAQEHLRTDQERVRAEQEHSRAERERLRAEQERMRAESLAAQLRALGVEPKE